MSEPGELPGVWEGCGHPHKVLLFCDCTLHMIEYMEFVENNPKKLCWDCWQKEMMGDGK